MTAPAQQRELNFERQRYACRTCMKKLGLAQAVVMALRPQTSMIQGARGEHVGWRCPRGDHRPWDEPRREAA